MKLAMIAFTFSLLAMPTTAALIVHKKNTISFLKQNASCDQKSGKPQGHGYGKNKCPCVGIDNLRGYFAANLDFHLVQYPLEAGASCNTWEKGVHPECAGEPMPDWCRQSWCYVDPCHCDLDVPPKRTNMGVTFQGNPAYFSYDTCNAFDFWSAEKNKDACVNQKDAASCSSKADCAWNGGKCQFQEAAQVCASSKTMPVSTYGSQDCRCVGFGGRKNGKAVRFINAHEEATYNSNVGSSCEAWEMEAHHECKKDGPKPGWCSQKWCYVDPCKCNLAKPPTAVMNENQNERFQGKTAYWSYETCGSTDLWTETLKEEYCPTYTTEASCEKVGKNKCMWTGDKCMGKALGELCAEQKSSGVLGVEVPLESGDRSFGPFAMLALASGFLVVM